MAAPGNAAGRAAHPAPAAPGQGRGVQKRGAGVRGTGDESPTFAIDLTDPDFAGIAGAAGLFGRRAETAEELESALQDAFAHDGPALVDVRTARHELSLPPKLTCSEIKGFTLYATRTILSGNADELVELTRTSLHEVEAE
jgi:pyruvate dehydrogenase (quinone)